MLAEAVVRGGSDSDVTTALGYVNELRERAFGSDAGAVTSGELTPDFILDERAVNFIGMYMLYDLIRL